jgi:hypothetical protein
MAQVPSSCVPFVASTQAILHCVFCILHSWVPLQDPVELVFDAAEPVLGVAFQGTEAGGVVDGGLGEEAEDGQGRRGDDGCPDPVLEGAVAVTIDGGHGGEYAGGLCGVGRGIR